MNKEKKLVQKLFLSQSCKETQLFYRRLIRTTFFFIFIRRFQQQQLHIAHFSAPTTNLLFDNFIATWKNKENYFYCYQINYVFTT